MRAFVTAVLATLAAALVLPATALADEGPARTVGGRLAQTGFEAWQVGLVGLALVAVAFVVLRRTRLTRD